MIKLWIGGIRKIPLKCNVILHLVTIGSFALEGGMENDLAAIRLLLISKKVINNLVAIRSFFLYGNLVATRSFLLYKNLVT